MNTKQTKLPESVRKLLSLLKSFKGLVIKKKPEQPDFDQYGPSWNQTEEEYQKEQKSWIEGVQKKRDNKP